MVPSRASVLSLYRQTLRAAKQFSNYNFREYSLRYVREDFRAAMPLSDADAIAKAYQRGKIQLQMLQRQSAVSAMYPQMKHAME
jgi:hypothetical protein